VAVCTSISADLSSYVSLSRPSGLNRSQLMDVLLEPLTSLMKIYTQNIEYTIKSSMAVVTHFLVLLQYLSMPTQHLRIEIAIVFSRSSTCIHLSSNLDTLVIGGIDVFYEGVGVD
jgi:hypothetical protein